jgi:hypothetical protein
MSSDGAFDQADNQYPKAEFEVTFWHKSCCKYLRVAISVAATFLSLMSLTLDLSYTYLAPFQRKYLFLLACGFLVVRFVVVMVIGQIYYSKFVRNYSVRTL